MEEPRTNLARLKALALRWLEPDGQGSRAVGPLSDVLVLRCTSPTPLSATLYEPVVCLILQGAKQVLLGDATYRLGAGEVLVVSHDVPVNSRITTARAQEPYLAVILSLDVSLLRSLYDETGRAGGEAELGRSDPPALASAAADPRLVDAIARYLALVGDPVEARVLAPAIRREIHYRLLVAPNGGMLRSLLRHDSHASTVAAAISRIRERYRETIAVPELAREVGMSPSSLHKHFRAITATTPLQFQRSVTRPDDDGGANDAGQDRRRSRRPMPAAGDGAQSVDQNDRPERCSDRRAQSVDQNDRPSRGVEAASAARRGDEECP